MGFAFLFDLLTGVPLAIFHEALDKFSGFIQFVFDPRRGITQVTQLDGVFANIADLHVEWGQGLSIARLDMIDGKDSLLAL